jgi:hypothetical protein
MFAGESDWRARKLCYGAIWLLVARIYCHTECRHIGVHATTTAQHYTNRACDACASPDRAPRADSSANPGGADRRADC